jgi:hypothetical protein
MRLQQGARVVVQKTENDLGNQPAPAQTGLGANVSFEQKTTGAHRFHLGD